MDEKQFAKDFVKCKVNAIDAAYVGTALSKGIYEARASLKYILFDFKDDNNKFSPSMDKYLYISSKNGGRELIKLVDGIDIIHILAKFSMQAFGVLGKDFNITNEEFLKIRALKKIKLEGDKLIEFIAYSSSEDHYDTYMLLSKHKYLCIKLFDLLVDYRYKKKMIRKYTKFDGTTNARNYKKQYKIIDESYLEIKNLLNV